MGFGHLYAQAPAPAVLEAIDVFLPERGFVRFEMTPDLHPKKMKAIHETDLRLFWVSPQIGRWTGIFEFRYYNNEFRERWGYTDETLAPWLSSRLAAPVYRMEVVDTGGFWMYSRYEEGKEIEGKVFQDDPTTRSTDPGHPRYELNRILEREGIRNVGLGYENIPGTMVSPVENCRFWKDGIEGLEGFVHRAYRSRVRPPSSPP